MPFVLFFIVAFILLIWMSGGLHLKNFQPFLHDGMQPVIKAFFPGLVTFPFGELIAFLVILPLIRKSEYVKKTSVIAVLISGLVLILSAVVQIANLGYNLRERATFPLLNAAKSISIGEFFERVDAVIVFVMMLGILIKSGVLFFCGVKGIEHILSRSYRPFVFPLAILIALSSVIVSDNYAEHFVEGVKIVTKYVHVPMQFIIPVFILGLIWRKWKKGGKKQHVS